MLMWFMIDSVINFGYCCGRSLSPLQRFYYKSQGHELQFWGKSLGLLSTETSNNTLKPQGFLVYLLLELILQYTFPTPTMLKKGKIVPLCTFMF